MSIAHTPIIVADPIMASGLLSPGPMDFAHLSAQRLDLSGTHERGQLTAHF